MIKRTILPEWNNSFISKKRLAILRSAVHAHIEKKYELSVPVLLTQLDGIPGAYFNHPSDIMKVCEEYFIAQESGGSAKKFTKDELMELVLLYLKSVIFAGIGNSNSKLMEINRHKILHGIYVNYGKESVSLKLILIVDILITYPKFVSLPNAKVYHMPHCAFYQNGTKKNKKKNRIIHTKLSAETNELRPCKHCIRPAKK